MDDEWKLQLIDGVPSSRVEEYRGFTNRMIELSKQPGGELWEGRGFSLEDGGVLRSLEGWMGVICEVLERWQVMSGVGEERLLEF